MKIQLFKDILKTKVEGSLKYSQGRIYLFVFVLCYLASLIYFMFIPNGTMQTIIDALQWAILLFAAYVFGTNGVTVTKDILKKGSDVVIPPAQTTSPTPLETTSAKTNPNLPKEEDMCT